jgi:hypothetical protein
MVEVVVTRGRTRMIILLATLVLAQAAVPVDSVWQLEVSEATQDVAADTRHLWLELRNRGDSPRVVCPRSIWFQYEDLSGGTIRGSVTHACETFETLSRVHAGERLSIPGSVPIGPGRLEVSVDLLDLGVRGDSSDARGVTVVGHFPGRAASPPPNRCSDRPAGSSDQQAEPHVQRRRITMQ